MCTLFIFPSIHLPFGFDNRCDIQLVCAFLKNEKKNWVCARLFMYPFGTYKHTCLSQLARKMFSIRSFVFFILNYGHDTRIVGRFHVQSGVIRCCRCIHQFEIMSSRNEFESGKYDRIKAEFSSMIYNSPNMTFLWANATYCMHRFISVTLTFPLFLSSCCLTVCIAECRHQNEHFHCANCGTPTNTCMMYSCKVNFTVH